ncbi:MAG TPA: zinc/iron-chelating domain-containing protein [Geobacteraceae bacterium]
MNCTFQEALCIAAVLTQQQAARVKSHALLVLDHIHKVADLKSYLRMHRQVIGSCPLLLDDGACGVYDLRPFSCRALLSTKEKHWCSVDFGRIPAAARAAFIESLDRAAVSFPMHYLYATQDIGQQLEARASMDMAARFGFSLSGNLPFLIYLEQEHQISKIIPHGNGITTDFLAQANLLHPYLVVTEEI